MTERGTAALARSATTLAIGPSALAATKDGLSIRIDERAAPIPRRLRGTITVAPDAWFGQPIALDPEGNHFWHPLAPVARVFLEFDSPRIAWHGHAYLDSNFGARPIEDDFSHWDWSRARTHGGALVLYDAVRADGGTFALARNFFTDGRTEDAAMPPRAHLPKGLWRMQRTTHGSHAKLVRPLEDSPFYTRSLIETDIGGTRLAAVHESLDLRRFRQPWVRALLPFRMPR